MCYSVAVVSVKEALTKRFEAKMLNSMVLLPYSQISGFAHPLLPVIRSNDPAAIVCNRWGLIPPWISSEEKAADIAKVTLNARVETVFEKPSFKDAIAKNRCLVLVDGFYEWQTVGKKKTPFFIRLQETGPFALGGIYSDWLNKETGEIVQSFSILTTPANALMAEIHNTKQRMPLILDRAHEQKWLDPDLGVEGIQELMVPFASACMQAERLGVHGQQGLLL